MKTKLFSGQKFVLRKVIGNSVTEHHFYYFTEKWWPYWNISVAMPSYQIARFDNLHKFWRLSLPQVMCQSKSWGLAMHVNIYGSWRAFHQFNFIQVNRFQTRTSIFLRWHYRCWLLLDLWGHEKKLPEMWCNKDIDAVKRKSIQLECWSGHWASKDGFCSEVPLLHCRLWNHLLVLIKGTKWAPVFLWYIAMSTYDCSSKMSSLGDSDCVPKNTLIGGKTIGACVFCYCSTFGTLLLFSIDSHNRRSYFVSTEQNQQAALICFYIFHLEQSSHLCIYFTLVLCSCASFVLWWEQFDGEGVLISKVPRFPWGLRIKHESVHTFLLYVTSRSSFGVW